MDTNVQYTHTHTHTYTYNDMRRAPPVHSTDIDAHQIRNSAFLTERKTLVNEYLGQDEGCNTNFTGCTTSSADIALPPAK